jgi:hypothetical protein
MYQRKLTRVEVTERGLIHVGSILISWYESKQFCMGEEQFSLYYNQVSLVKDPIPDPKVDGPKLYATPNHL